LIMANPNKFSMSKLFKNFYGHFMHDSLRRSSSFLILNSSIGAVFGFCFWLICAHLSSSTQIGYSTTLIAYISLISTVTTLGLSNAVIRFLPNHQDKDEYFGTALAITFVSSLIIGSLLIESIKYFSPKLSFAISNPEIFGLLLSFLVLTSVGSIASSSLLAQKDAKNIFIMALCMYPLRIILPFLFPHIKIEGILTIILVSTLIGTAYEFYILYKKHHKRLKINLSSLYDSYKFTVGNFTGTIFGILPGTLVPIIVLNKLGPSLAAYFYIAMQFAGLLGIICSSNAQAFLAESSNDKNPKRYMYHFAKGFRNMYSLLVPAALLMAIVGTQLLRLYGYTYYSHGAILLTLLCVASLFIGVNWLGDALLNVQKRPVAYGAMNFINALIVVVVVYEFANRGLTAVGFSWLAAQAATVIIYILLQYNFLKTYRLSADS
jgi:O-antigen/teichoic acid export membrane protein